nr:serine/threonine protein kinase [Acidobacteriota bacterium]
MSHETAWSDSPRPLHRETIFINKSPAGLKAAEAAVAEEWRVGDVILDLYEVLGVLGEGGMGKVYRVHHKNWNIDLAVKTPRPEIINKAGGKESFISEAETWVKLGLHPHTVSCYYVRELGGIPRVFAEFVEGGSLKDWIEAKKLYEGGAKKALERILDIAIQFAWGLHYAHEQGLVHRDVKPDNVMMTPEGAVKVTDFGLAKAHALSGSGSEQLSGTVLVKGVGGTPAYSSPEQVAGKPLSRKTDIWSWAVSVLEMFTGEMTWMSGEAAVEALEEYLEDANESRQIPKMPDGVAELLRRSFN